ncbi:MAG: YdeI/OmpD-associated family protein [Candidatus Paceibacteria bacterium]
MKTTTKVKVPGGTVHSVPIDLRKLLVSVTPALATWVNITPLARNEWICWVDSAQKEETRKRRLRILGENLSKGKRRPCCWAGCPHRAKQPK